MRVSVLLTSFEHERYIAQALDGVLAQEGVEFELLAGDDASTDGTRDVIARYAREHPGVIRPFFPEQNMGNGGKAIFAALMSQARGDYLAVLDADDYWTAPDKLRRQVAYLDEQPEAAMCFHDVLCVYEDDDRPDAPLQRARPAGGGHHARAARPLRRRLLLTPVPARRHPAAAGLVLRPALGRLVALLPGRSSRRAALSGRADGRLPHSPRGHVQRAGTS